MRLRVRDHGRQGEDQVPLKVTEAWRRALKTLLAELEYQGPQDTLVLDMEVRDGVGEVTIDRWGIMGRPVVVVPMHYLSGLPEDRVVLVYKLALDVIDTVAYLLQLGPASLTADS